MPRPTSGSVRTQRLTSQVSKIGLGRREARFMTADSYEKWLELEKSYGVGIFPVMGYAPRK